jgi:hypothetical protein
LIPEPIPEPIPDVIISDPIPIEPEYATGLIPYEPVWPARSPGNVDHGVSNPLALWNNDCGATEHNCAGMQYYGGHGECGQGHTIWRTFSSEYEIHPQADKVIFTGKIWTIDSWDGETFTIEMTNAAGAVMASETIVGNNFSGLADSTI